MSSSGKKEADDLFGLRWNGAYKSAQTLLGFGAHRRAAASALVGNVTARLSNQSWLAEK